MIPIEIRDGLPYVPLEVHNGGNAIVLRNALLDTGSHSTILATESVESIDLRPEQTDVIREIFGIGGTEAVVEMRVQRLVLAEGSIVGFTVELGGMDYGIDLDAIVGLDLLRELGAVIDLRTMQLHVNQQESA
jgi:predicted aspartyl protease